MGKPGLSKQGLQSVCVDNDRIFLGGVSFAQERGALSTEVGKNACQMQIYHTSILLFSRAGVLGLIRIPESMSGRMVDCTGVMYGYMM